MADPPVASMGSTRMTRRFSTSFGRFWVFHDSRIRGIKSGEETSRDLGVWALIIRGIRPDKET